MSDQTDIWATTEGNAWNRRNRDKTSLTDRVLQQLDDVSPQITHALEIGCGNGRRLFRLQQAYNCKVYGVDVSSEAIKDAEAMFPSVQVYGYRADALPFSPDHFDLVIFGFVLYACDPGHLFRIAMEADRVLADKGLLVIYDFHADFPHSRSYAHDRRLRSYKMDFAKLFLAHPFYSLASRRIYGTETNVPLSADDAVAVTILRKNIETAFPLKDWNA